MFNDPRMVFPEKLAEQKGTHLPKTNSSPLNIGLPPPQKERLVFFQTPVFRGRVLVLRSVIYSKFILSSYGGPQKNLSSATPSNRDMFQKKVPPCSEQNKPLKKSMARRWKYQFCAVQRRAVCFRVCAHPIWSTVMFQGFTVTLWGAGVKYFLMFKTVQHVFMSAIWNHEPRGVGSNKFEFVYMYIIQVTFVLSFSFAFSLGFSLSFSWCNTFFALILDLRQSKLVTRTCKFRISCVFCMTFNEVHRQNFTLGRGGGWPKWYIRFIFSKKAIDKEVGISKSFFLAF